MKSLRKAVFIPPFVLVAFILIVSFFDAPGFEKLVNHLNETILSRFDKAFAWTGFLCVLTCSVIALIPFGKVKLGGDSAKRLLSPFTWAAISLCTNTAVGILFWAMAEPMYHLKSPPASLSILPHSPEAANFALSTLFLHWSFTPAAIYTLPALVFGYAFYNLRLPFSLASCLYPLFGRRSFGMIGNGIDALCLYALVAGMAASLATGVLTLAGGLQHTYGISSSPWLWNMIGIAIVGAFLLSAVTGIHRGISMLSKINTYFFFILAIFVLCWGPTRQIAYYSWNALSDYVVTFVDKNLFLSFSPNDPWPRQWTVFYWSVWMAWTPITAVFLGRIGVGYSIRAFLLVNFVLPAVFAIVWMGIFGGTAIAYEAQKILPLGDLLAKQGPERLAYAVFEHLPLAGVVIPMFLFTVFISYVTAADSNTIVMAGMSSHGISPESPDPSLWLKLVWGALVGTLALVMLQNSGIEGIKTLCYLGGLPALIFEVLSMASLIVIAVSYRTEAVSTKSVLSKT